MGNSDTKSPTSKRHGEEKKMSEEGKAPARFSVLPICSVDLLPDGRAWNTSKYGQTKSNVKKTLKKT